MQNNLKSCPFCGWQPPNNDPDQMLDVLYRSGTWWADEQHRRIYRSHKHRKPTDNPCWVMNCTEHMGGCSAQLTGDTLDEVTTKWNSRKP